jgi:hypothetical protein
MYKVVFSFLKVSAIRLASNSSLAILLQQFFSLKQSCSVQQSFSFQSLPYQKASLHPKSQKPKAFKAKPPKAKTPKAKSLGSSFSESFISSGKQGGAAVPGEGRDTVTGETWFLLL